MESPDREQVARFLSESTTAEEWRTVVEPDVNPALAEAYDAYLEAMAEGDLEYVLALTHPEIVITQPPDFPGGREYRGHEGLIETFADWPRQWEEFSVTPRRIYEPRPGRLMVLGTHHLRGAGSGVELDVDIWWLFDWEDGRMTRWQMFATEDGAEAALEG